MIDIKCFICCASDVTPLKETVSGDRQNMDSGKRRSMASTSRQNNNIIHSDRGFRMTITPQ